MRYSPPLLARIFQLATPFEFQNPNLNAKDCANYIRGVDHPRETLLSSHTIAASAIQSLEDDCHYFITIEHQYREPEGWYSSARLDGEITRDTNPDATLAKGIIKIHPIIAQQMIALVLFGLAALWIFGSIPTISFLGWFVLILCFAIAGYCFWTAFSDRNSLFSTIEYLMTEARSLPPEDQHENAADDEYVEIRFPYKAQQFQIFDETPEPEIQPTVTSAANKQ